MRICTELKRPSFEVKSWPKSEIEWWAVVFSIRDNDDKPTVKTTMTEKQSIDAMKALLQ